ncbi:MAG: hypothetical protein KBD16_00825 [Candidatus Pacebacteria bacterium]|nr:hypothetical protein [Candidatus Paceibacterota bacterium]
MKTNIAIAVLFIGLIGLVFVGFGSSVSFGAAPSIFRPSQGGTGLGSATAGDVGKFLSVSDDSPFTYTFSDPASGSFSTTSSNFWASVGLAFSTTSTDYWETQQASRGADGTFSTTSASYFSSLGLAFSTTSSDYWKTQNTFESLTAGDGLTRTSNDFDCDTASGSVFGCLSAANWTTFNNKQDTITAGDALTLTGTDIDFDGGASPSGDLGGTWASPSVTDDSHAHTSTTISGVDISADTNLAVTYPLILTGDTLSTAFGTTTTNVFSALNTFSNSTSTLFTATTAWLTNLFIGADTIAEYISDTAGAMWTGNTETDITITYQDADNTIDAVVDTLPNLTGTLDVDSGGTGVATLTGVAIGNGTGVFTAGSAQTCTNQFFRALSAAYAVTCATVQSEDINLGDTYVWTSVHDFGGGTSIEMVNGTAPTVDAIGEFALDTTSNQFLVASSTNATYPLVFDAERSRCSTAISTSTLDYIGGFAAAGTTTLDWGARFAPELVNRIACYTDAGTTTIRYGDGTNWMSYIQCGSGSNTIEKSTGSSNNAFTSREKRKMEIGTLIGSMNTVTICEESRVTRE